MMRLSTLWRVDSTIDEDGSSPVAEQLLVRWPHDQGSARFFRSSSNFLYRFHDEGQGRFLRFTDAEERGRDTVNAEMGIVQALDAAGIAVAAPVSSRSGNVVETVETDWGTFHAVVLPAMEGEQYELDELDAAGMRHWGAALGELHAALNRTSDALSNLHALPTWSDHLAFIQRHLPPDSAALQSEYEYLASMLAGLPVNGDSYGTIHCDFELDNLVWRGDAATILDFDDSAHMWYAADVAFATRELFADRTGEGSNVRTNPDDPRFRAFVEGFREHRVLSEESLAQVPFFLRFARFLDYARNMRTLDLPEGEQQPSWLANLRDRLSRNAAVYRAAVEAPCG